MTYREKPPRTSAYTAPCGAFFIITNFSMSGTLF